MSVPIARSQKRKYRPKFEPKWVWWRLWWVAEIRQAPIGPSTSQAGSSSAPAWFSTAAMVITVSSTTITAGWIGMTKVSAGNSQAVSAASAQSNENEANGVGWRERW